MYCSDLVQRAKLWRRRFTAFFPVTQPFYIRSAMLLHYTWHCLCNHSCHCVTSRTSQPAGYVSSNISKSPSIIPKMCKHIIYHMYMYIYININKVYLYNLYKYVIVCEFLYILTESHRVLVLLCTSWLGFVQPLLNRPLRLLQLQLSGLLLRPVGLLTASYGTARH